MTSSFELAMTSSFELAMTSSLEPAMTALPFRVIQIPKR
jgi:hypothetical protein